MESIGIYKQAGRQTIAVIESVTHSFLFAENLRSKKEKHKTKRKIIIRQHTFMHTYIHIYQLKIEYVKRGQRKPQF